MESNIIGPWGDKYEQAISDYCDNLKSRLLEKYAKGKHEHGDLDAGNPIDCSREIIEEVLDIINYHLIDKVQEAK